MSTIACGACGAVNDAPLCRGCTAQLRKALRKLPGLIDDLLTAATGQAVIDDARPVIVTQAARADAQAVEREHAAVPARLRSRDGRITLPSTVLPVSLPLMALHAQAVAGVLDWLERAGVDTVPRPLVGGWLAGHADRIRHSEHGPEIHARALDLKATIEATVDRRPPDVFAGVCETVAVEVNYATGHITPTAGPCGTPLLARPGEDSVQCPKCRASWDVDERREAMADKVADRLGTVREVAGFLRTLELDVTVDKIDGWLRRGRIVDHGSSASGRLVKIGEVREYAEHVARKRDAGHVAAARA